MSQRDPLAISVWKLYERSLKSAPNSRRLSNLTWRMASMKLMRQDQEKGREEVVSKKSVTSSGPSGIARLHKANPPQHADQMNIDEFIDPSSVASPADPSPSPPHQPTSRMNTSAAIPIKGKKTEQSRLPPASAPIHAKNVAREEFNYVQRQVRKTSIDEGKV
jgi:GATA-binding protein